MLLTVILSLIYLCIMTYYGTISGLSLKKSFSVTFISMLLALTVCYIAVKLK